MRHSGSGPNARDECRNSREATGRDHQRRHRIGPCAQKGLSLELTRAFAAPCARVVEFFTDAALLAEWWGPQGFSIPSIEFAPGVGASYRIEMQPPEGQAFALTGSLSPSRAVVPCLLLRVGAGRSG